MNKSTLVAKATLHTFVKWSKWYTAMFIGIFLVIVVLLNHLSTYDWSLLQGYLQSTRIFFLILGLMSMRGFLEYFVSNGVTRKDYFKGLASASARLAIVMTIAGLIFTAWNGSSTSLPVGNSVMLGPLWNNRFSSKL